MDVTEYKKLQEEHVSNLNGTSRYETIIQMTPIPFSILVCTLSVPFLFPRRRKREISFFTTFSFEFLLLVIPLTLTLTVLNDNLLEIVVCLLLLVILCTYLIIRDLPRNKFQKCLHMIWTSEITEKNVSIITMYRAVTNFVTALCICAVDFKIFPRKFAKTEYFGYSVMDVGVGLFCIANAVVSPEVKCRIAHNQLTSRYVLKTIAGCVPLLILGLTRFFMLRNVDYQLHVTEYGVHWNFFITLVCVKISSSLVLYVMGNRNVGLLALLTTLAHQSVLSAGIQQWVFDENTKRTNIFTANREGIVSVLGYLAIYLSGVYVGCTIKNTGKRFCDYIFLSLKFTVVIIIFWLGTAMSENLFGVSRRLANTGYVIWIICVSLIFFEMFLLCLLFVHSVKIFVSKNVKQNSLEFSYVPILYEAVNFNGLACFLLSNILTGIINILFYTLTFSDFISLITVLFYIYVVCLSMAILYWKKIQFKFW